MPGISTLVIMISKVRERVSKRLWQRLSSLANPNQKEHLENLLLIPLGKRYSKLDEMPSHLTKVSQERAVLGLVLS